MNNMNNISYKIYEIRCPACRRKLMKLKGSPHIYPKSTLVIEETEGFQMEIRCPFCKVFVAVKSE